MKAYFEWYNRCYEVVNPNTKKAKQYCGEFYTHQTPDGVSLYDCYNNPSQLKENAYRDLVDMFSYTTVTGFNSMRFTAMSTLEGLKALFIDTGVNCYVVADRADLKQFADELNVTFCEYREGR